MADSFGNTVPWFAGRDGVFLLYRVNRRPKGGQRSLFEVDHAEFFDHLVECLVFGGEPIRTGRRYQRSWLLGNRDIDLEKRIVTGHVGWERSDVTFADRYDQQAKSWVDAVGTREETARSPFAIDGTTQELVVLRHPTFSEETLAAIFTQILNAGEEAREVPTTDWDVEPLLDEQDFREWLSRTDVVDEVSFVAKLPNPDALEEFGPVLERMERIGASTLREEAQARDPETGLSGILEDPTFAAFFAMAARAYGYVRAKGSDSGRNTVFDQRRKVARRYEADMPTSWTELVGLVVGFVLGRRAEK